MIRQLEYYDMSTCRTWILLVSSRLVGFTAGNHVSVSNDSTVTQSDGSASASDAISWTADDPYVTTACDDDELIKHGFFSADASS